MAVEQRVTWRPGAYAGFWQRAAGALIDGMLWLVAYFAVLLVVGLGGVGAGADPDTFASTAGGLVNVVFLVGYVVYDVVLTARNGATIGKRAAGIEVRTIDGALLPYGLAFARVLARAVSAVPFFIGFLWPAFDERKQTLHDKVCSTVVVKSAEVAPFGATDAAARTAGAPAGSGWSDSAVGEPAGGVPAHESVVGGASPAGASPVGAWRGSEDRDPRVGSGWSAGGVSGATMETATWGPAGGSSEASDRVQAEGVSAPDAGDLSGHEPASATTSGQPPGNQPASGEPTPSDQDRPTWAPPGDQPASGQPTSSDQDRPGWAPPGDQPASGEPTSSDQDRPGWAPPGDQPASGEPTPSDQDKQTWAPPGDQPAQEQGAWGPPGGGPGQGQREQPAWAQPGEPAQAPAAPRAADPNVVAIDRAGLSNEAAAWLRQVAAQVDPRLQRVNPAWPSSVQADAARACAFGILLGHLARMHPHMAADLSRVAEVHPSFSTLLEGSRLATLEQIAADPGRATAWLGPLIDVEDRDRVGALLA